MTMTRISGPNNVVHLSLEEYLHFTAYSRATSATVFKSVQTAVTHEWRTRFIALSRWPSREPVGEYRLETDEALSVDELRALVRTFVVNRKTRRRKR